MDGDDRVAEKCVNEACCLQCQRDASLTGQRLAMQITTSAPSLHSALTRKLLFNV